MQSQPVQDMASDKVNHSKYYFDLLLTDSLSATIPYSTLSIDNFNCLSKLHDPLVRVSGSEHIVWRDG